MTPQIQRIDPLSTAKIIAVLNGVMGLVIYNLIAGWVGGIEVELG